MIFAYFHYIPIWHSSSQTHVLMLLNCPDNIFHDLDYQLQKFYSICFRFPQPKLNVIW